MSKTIGIIGGMGPRATIQFEQMIIDQFEGGDQDMPSIISINSGKIPDRTKYLLAQGEDPVPQIQDAVDKLAQLGVDVLAMPCNTAHTLQILGRVNLRGVELIHMPAITAQFVAERRYKRVALLATTGTIKSSMYQRMLDEYYVEALVPPKNVQRLVMQVISLIKNGNFVKSDKLMTEINGYLASQEADAAILACTELSFVVGSLTQSVQPVDSMLLLAQAAASFTIKETEKENEPRRIYA